MLRMPLVSCRHHGTLIRIHATKMSGAITRQSADERKISMATNTIESQILSGETWAAFCDSLKRSGQQILRPEAPQDAFTCAEGYRYLSRLLRIALEMHVEFS